MCDSLTSKWATTVVKRRQQLAEGAQSLITFCLHLLLLRLPPESTVQKVAEEMFEVADVNNDNEISFEEFLDWSRKHVASQSLLRTFKRVRRHHPCV